MQALSMSGPSSIKSVATVFILFAPSSKLRECATPRATIADLHHVIQVLMGWEDDHLHRFRIHGRGCRIRLDQAGSVPQGGVQSLGRVRIVVSDPLQRHSQFSSRMPMRSVSSGSACALAVTMAKAVTRGSIPRM
jgi:hypothetical protein